MLDVTRDTEPITEQKQEPVPHTLTTSKFEKHLELNDWRITTIRRPISNAKEIDALHEALDIPIPEMIFGGNLVQVSCPKLGIELSWTAQEALDAVDKTGTALKVAYSEHWNKTRDQHSEAIKHVTKPYDWTYTTAYPGSCRGCSWQESNESLPMALLKRQDPILLYDEIVLFEDELADNGTSLFSIRVRVMPERLLILARFFLRLDGVLFRVRDTRLYIGFGERQILREHTAREAPFETVKQQIPAFQQDEAGALLDDANWVLERCPVVERKMERLTFTNQAH